ncbi:heme ABC exporter ATP-binding protein CcmA [Paracoccus pacificus]|uniref:Heme ABC exporter ATP-binding protein CcmA n=1 Tax=Paracoccus pacificus TaxID=1463598 RepID=A0ABW4R5K4_9RHOB
MSPALALEDLAVERGGRRLLHGLNLTLMPGQAAVLTGPNGAGKTSLLRTIAGLQRPAAGRVRCQPDAIAYAGHADGVKSALTVSENLRFWAAVFGGDQIAPALAAMDLSALGDRLAGRLSAGQRRRLGLARLAVTGRPVWVLDEPTVSLDSRSADLFRAMLAAHLAGGGAAIIATHLDLGIEALRLELSEFAAPRDAAPLSGFDAAFA